jgi:hypothetical protein
LRCCAILCRSYQRAARNGQLSFRPYRQRLFEAAENFCVRLLAGRIGVDAEEQCTAVVFFELEYVMRSVLYALIFPEVRPVPDFIVAREASTSADCGTGFRDRQAPSRMIEAKNVPADQPGTGLGSACTLRGIARMESQLHIDDLLSVCRGAEDSALVVLQRLDSVGDIACMMGNVGGNPFP